MNLNLHRAPGYCVNPPKEPLDLWKDEKALEACAFHWAHFAKRYKGIPNERVSFDLLNEPADIPEETYVRVVKRLVEAIRAEDPQRLIIADGLRWGREPVYGLVELGIAQSTRGYEPMQISHYQASWIRLGQMAGANLAAEAWREARRWTRRPCARERIQPWKQLEQKGVGVHVGEWGAFNHTPHKVVLAWMRDYLALWKEAGWGWALWNCAGASACSTASGGCRVRGLPRPQARPADAGTTAAGLAVATQVRSLWRCSSLGISEPQPHGLQVGRLGSRDREVGRLRDVVPLKDSAGGALDGRVHGGEKLSGGQSAALVEANSTPPGLSRGRAAVTSRP